VEQEIINWEENAKILVEKKEDIKISTKRNIKSV
jgi:hypothetical protein